MSQSDLLHWIVTNPYFIKNYNTILYESIKKQFGDYLISSNEKSQCNWGYMLLCASLLSKADSIYYLDKALRIIQSCICSEASSEHKDMATILLNSLVNIPAIKLAQSRRLVKENIERRLNITSLLNWKRKEYESVIETSMGTNLYVNGFQNKFWKSLDNNNYVSITAPTAVGKTYITKHWIIDKINSKNIINIVYIVPTRALIYQLEEDFKQLLNEYDLINKVNIVSMPFDEMLDWNKSNIFIFTQERFYILLSSLNFNFNVFAIIIDEAYKIEDENRGLLLQQIIEWGFSKNNKPEMVFISPFTKNPEKFIEDAKISDAKDAFISNEVTVNQNILWAIQKKNFSKKWELKLINTEDELFIGDFDLSATPDSGIKRISYVVNALTNNKNIRSIGNIVYVNGAADAEKVARHLYDFFKNDSEKENVKSLDPRLISLIDLCKKTIHEKYVLCKVLEQGIAFHYGNMPILIKNEIEKLFNENIITHLICTSTLVEGVNMSCRTIFMRGPKKGKNKLMNNADFWNLAGRAGRWGKEFQGNIICIDPMDNLLWIDGAAPKKRSQYIIKKISDTMKNKYSSFLEYLVNMRNNANINIQFDQFISYLLIQYRKYGTIRKYFWSQNYPEIDKLEQEISLLSSQIEIPLEVIEHNPGINPIYIENLLKYFREWGRDVEDLLLCDPYGENAVNTYNMAFQRINNHLTKMANVPNLLYAYSIIVINWMRGYPLSRIISERIKYMERKQRTYNIDGIIRETMHIIEEIARYIAPKYLKCYNDTLKYYLSTISRDDLISEVKDYSIFLEFGVSRKSQLSLLSLGFSRTAISYISDYMVEDNLDKNECLRWFEDHKDWINWDIPDKIKLDIQLILAESLT